MKISGASDGSLVAAAIRGDLSMERMRGQAGNRRFVIRRHGKRVCWHAHRDFMRAVLHVCPEAVIRTSIATYRGYLDFEDRHESTKKPGPNTCGCPEEEVARV